MSRKTVVNSFFMLCVLALATAPAFGQGVAFQASSLPQQARFEGLTETMGAVVLQATGAGSIPGGSSITVLYSGSITNTPNINSLSGSFTIGATPTPCSGATCNGGTGSSTASPSFSVTASGNQLTVAVNGTSSQYVAFKQGDYLVISQVRVNVNALGSSVTTVTATMSGTSSTPTTNPITFTQAVVPVASIVNPSLSVSRVSSSRTFQTCSIGAQSISIGATERYPAALTSATDESGFTPSFSVANGTAVTVSFAGIPSGMAIQLTGTSFTSSLSASTALSVSPTSSAAVTSNGSAIAYTFTVLTDSTSTIDTITFNFNLGLPGSTSGTILGTTGTLPAIGTTNAVVATVGLGPVQASPVVAFAANTQGTTTVANISDCVTNMLFPYITNQGGYDSSFSIANTTNDDLAFGANLGANPQSGTCTLSFWPTTDTTQGTPGTATTFTTPSIPTGAVYAFSQSGTSFSGQTGYMIAVCRFLNAHGFAFITNGFAVASGPRISSGYLGLIIPNPVGGRTSPNGETLTN